MTTPDIPSTREANKAVRLMNARRRRAEALAQKLEDRAWKLGQAHKKLQQRANEARDYANALGAEEPLFDGDDV